MNPTNEQRTFAIQVTGSSLSVIKEALDLREPPRAGTETPLPQGATLKVEDVSKSSGFDFTTVILTAVVTVATSASQDILIEWLKSRLFKSGEPQPSVTILIDGKEIQVRTKS